MVSIAHGWARLSRRTWMSESGVVSKRKKTKKSLERGRRENRNDLFVLDAVQCAL